MERSHRLIVLRIRNIISSVFLVFSIHSLCWMQDAKSMQNVGDLESVFDQSISRLCFHREF